jgi:hypothetical protein
MKVDIYIGTDKVDLFKEESIEVNSSVADIEDITKNTTDYTKTFTVPASKENNKLFKHWYNADVDNSFDARIKVDGSIELDGMLFRIGKFRLSKVAVKHGAPSSYTINFWGNLLSLKDSLGKDELSDLDLTAYDHGYNSANVFTGLVSTGFMNDGIVYNLLAKKQYYYNSDPTDTSTTDALTNIGYGNGSGSNGVIWNDLRPSIRLIKIIEAIESDYGLTFSRDFFGRTEFNNLFLWLNSKKKSEIDGLELDVDFDEGSSTNVNLTTNIGTFFTENTPRKWWRLYLTVIPSPGYENVDYTIKYYRSDDDSGNEFIEQAKLTQAGAYQWLNNLHASGASTTYKVYYTIQASQEFKFTTSFFQQRKNFFGNNGDWTTTSSEQTLDSDFVVKDNIPKLKTIDFLKGLFKEFKLVVIPQDDGSIYINTLDSYYAEGGIYDVTNYVDFDSYDVSRGKILNEINFLFQEPSTILNKTFEENEGIAYGDQETILKDDDGDVLDGETLEFTLPFEQVLFERLTDINDDAPSSVQYGAIIDENLAAVNPKPVIYYNIYNTLDGKPVGFINDNGGKESLNNSINTPSSTIDFETMNFSTLFDSEFSSWDGRKINNTLYTNYHEKYLLSIFNIKKRSFNYKAKNIPLRVLLDLELNDILQIKENFYRIDNFTSNLVTGEVGFNLVNSFGDAVNTFDASPTNFSADNLAQQLSTYVTNLGNFSFNKVDTGDGVGWVTVTNTNNNVLFDLDHNSGGTVRTIIIDLIQAVTLQEIRIYINQGLGIATFDSGTATFDSNLLTFDNG